MHNCFSEKRNFWLECSDEAFCKECRIDSYQASGPGGQKRNKKLSAIRMTHLPTGLFVTSEQSRSLAVNKSDAIKKLKFNIAAKIRGSKIEIDSIDISKKNDKYNLLIAKIFDSLVKNEFKIKESAVDFGLSTSGFIKFISKDERVWRIVNQERQKLGYSNLKNR